MRNIKEIDIKNGTYYFFDDMINIKNSDSNLLKIDKKLYRNINIYYMVYITMKDFEIKIDSVNPLYSMRLNFLLVARYLVLVARCSTRNSEGFIFWLYLVPSNAFPF